MGHIHAVKHHREIQHKGHDIRAPETLARVCRHGCAVLYLLRLQVYLLQQCLYFFAGRAALHQFFPDQGMANRILHPVLSHKICRSAGSVCSLEACRTWLQVEPQVAIQLLAFYLSVQGRQFAFRERSLHLYRQSRGGVSNPSAAFQPHQLRPHALSQQRIVGGHHDMPRAAAAKFAGKGAGAENQRKKQPE